MKGQVQDQREEKAGESHGPAHIGKEKREGRKWEKKSARPLDRARGCGPLGRLPSLVCIS